ncbi:unnamed protein product [Polarella glacialis]|uniref:Bestrophin homolog n=1 Tax=Polarella glacialis TaxID=89957 RepID=A0A813KBL4_POLGL|nr:unnamed protein product [Polarella glacialis]
MVSAGPVSSEQGWPSKDRMEETLLEVLTQRKQRTADKPPTQTDYFLPGCHSCSSKRGRRVITFKPVSSGCDVWGWLQTVLSLRGRSMLHMMPPFLLVMVMTVTRALAMETTLFGGRRWDLPDLKGDGYSLLMVPLSFLLVYRLNRAAVRFYDSRAAVGKLIECCRNLASEAATFCAHDPEARDEVCRWLVAFPVATRNYLRAETPDPLLDLQGVLSLADAQALLRAPVQTLFCCDRIRQAVLRATRSNNIDNPVLAASMFGRMEDMICTLSGSMGAMERINNTPLPFVYVAHIRSLLVFYLLGLPWSLDYESAWEGLIVVVFISFALLGVESAAVACERPFQNQRNHLPLDLYANVVAENIRQTLETVTSVASSSSLHHLTTSPGSEAVAPHDEVPPRVNIVV